MHLALVTLSLQLGLAPVPSRPAHQHPAGVADSLRDLRAARSAQASFERARRYSLPPGGGSSGRCDVQLGRFCWWYDERPVTLPAEPRSITRRRAALVETLDALAERRPGDEWVAGMRVYYRLDGGLPEAADSVARGCRASTWWCLALNGYTNHVLGRSAAAEAAFAGALDAMSDVERCAWRDIAPLLPQRMRERYARSTCDARSAVEARYWMLSRPRLSEPANEWRTEYFVRRIQSRLAEHAVSPQPSSWGRDSDELLLRYGWPVGWSRADSPASLSAEPSIVGHDPTPSFPFAPDEAVLDTATRAADDAWDVAGREPSSRIAESRYAPRFMTRTASVATQIARFRRGDETLLAAAYATADDSLRAGAMTALGATTFDGATLSVALGGGTVGRGVLRLAGAPQLVGVELADTVTRTFARSRTLYPPGDASTSRFSMSDLLVYRGGDDPPASLETALALAIPGDTASRARPIGVFWETYGVSSSGEELEVTVTVERVDRRWLRGARQRLGLMSPDSPLRLKWSDARPPRDGPASRAISLDLANLDPGRYRVSVTLARPSTGSARDTTSASARREIQLLAR